ncbi:MAG: hypothetical protein HYZ74_04190 [Elusimicrobia bacterium]|nr:hypothetical protein [Elusimicrobiota bacterium]
MEEVPEIPGMQSILVDVEKNRPADAKHFIAADISDTSDANIRAITAKVMEYVEKNNLVVMGANTFNQAYIRIAPAIQAAAQISNNPAIRVNPAGAVDATVNKLETRQIVGESIKSLRWPAKSPGTIEDADIEERAVATFREIVKQTPSGKVVLKLVTAAGKAGLRAGGISTEQEMREAVRGVITEIKTYWRTNATLGNLYTVDHGEKDPPRLLIEGMIDRLSEVDVEPVVSILADGTLDIVGFIIGNPNPGEKEKGYLFGVDGFLSKELQRSLMVGAVESVLAVWHRFGALPFGNNHVEKMLRGEPSDPRPALVEINGTRPIGGTGMRFATEWHPEINLVRGGIRASLGLPQIVPKEQPKDSFLALAISPAVTGVIEKVELPADLAQAQLSEFGLAQSVSRKNAATYSAISVAGDQVEGADSPHPGAVGAVTVRGADGPDAVRKILPVLNSITAHIQTPDRGVRVQKGDEEHSTADYRVLPEPAEPTGWRKALGWLKRVFSMRKVVPQKPQMSAQADASLGHYEEAQMRWGTIFSVYGPLFSAAMNAMGGLAAIGIGRIGYTSALFVSSPFAAVISSRLPVRAVLMGTWAARIGIWAVGVPLAVALLPAGSVSLMVAMFALNFLDGLMVSFSHPVDMDAMGMDVLSKQNGFEREMNPEIRQYFGARYLAGLSKARFIFPLGIAVAVIVATSLALPIKWAFLAGMAGVFAIQGSRAISSVARIPDNAVMEPVRKSFWSEFRGGVSKVGKDRKLRGMVGLESLERSFGDVLVMVAFPVLALQIVEKTLGYDKTWANLFATALMAAMSYSGMIVSNATRLLWKAPAKDAAEYPAYKPLFPLMFVAGLATLTIPAAYFLAIGGHAIAGMALAAMGAFLLSFAFKPAQIGAMNMMQTTAGSDAKVAGISSAVQMAMAGAVVFVLGGLFDPKSLVHAVAAFLSGMLGLGFSTGTAFVMASAFCVAVGAAYWLIWPRLASRAPAK